MSTKRRCAAADFPAFRGFKGLKQAIKLEFKLGRYDKVRKKHIRELCS